MEARGALLCEPHKEREWTIGRRDGWLVIRIGLLRQSCGLGLEELAERVGLARTAVSDIARLHLRLLVSDAEYGGRASSIVSRALEVWREVGGGK